MPANIGAELQQLPLGYLLGSPLTAAIEGQALAAKSTIDFINKVGLEESATGDLSVRTAEFTYTAFVPDIANPGETSEVEAKLTVPILSIIPIPFIRIADLNVSFEFKIRDVSTNQSKTELTAASKFTVDHTSEGKLGGGFLGFLSGVSGTVENKTHFEISGSATYQSTNRNTTDRSATFKMTMNAVQDNMPEGLSRVLTIFNDTIQAQKPTS